MYGRRRPAWLAVAVAALAAAACGSSGSAAFSASASARSLHAAGWAATSSAGMPHTLAGVRQSGYLDVVAPDGAHLSLQFIADAAGAAKELRAIQVRQPNFAGTAVANVLVVPTSAAQPPAQDLAGIRAHLRH